jgi:DNA replication protein DnaC
MAETNRNKITDIMAQRRRLGIQPVNKPTQAGTSMLHLPDTVFQSMGGKPTAEEVQKTCAICGDIPPRKVANGWLPGKCACEREMAERERERREREEQQKRMAEQLRKSCAKCYTWLGPDWSDLDLDEKEKTFKNFDYAVQMDGMVAAMDMAEQRRGNLILWSDKSWGTGKTHLARAICKQLIEQNIPCRFTTAQNMFNAFGARMDEHQGYSDLLAEAGTTPLLVIDDLDKLHKAQSEFKQSILFEVLNKRYLRKLPTVITTNARVVMTDNDVEGISDYIGRAAASRLCDLSNGGLQVVEMNGDDYRRRNRKI